MHDEEGDDDILNGEEEVLAVRGEGELVTVRVCEGDCVRERLKDVGDE